MKCIITAAMLGVALASAADAFRPADEIDLSSGLSQAPQQAILCDQTVIVVSQGMWQDITNRVAFLERLARRQWNVQHSTMQGIMAWHGKKVKTEIDDESLTKTTIFSDGYRHVEKITRHAPARTPKAEAKQPAMRVNEPPRVTAMRERIRRAASEKRTVNVVFGPGMEAK